MNLIGKVYPIKDKSGKVVGHRTIHDSTASEDNTTIYICLSPDADAPYLKLSLPETKQLLEKQNDYKRTVCLDKSGAV